MTLTTPDPVAPQSTSEAVRSTVVLDTSVIVYDPECLFGFDGDDVVIPLTVISELDGLKTRRDEVGRNAREALRKIERLRVANGGQISDAAALDHGGTLRIETNGVHADRLVEFGLDPAVSDNRILGAARTLAGDGATRLMSNDAALRIKAAHMGIDAEEYVPRRGERVARNEWPTFDTSGDVIDRAYGAHWLSETELDAASGGDAVALAPNEPFVLRAGSQSALCRRTPEGASLIPTQIEAYGMRPRNKEQRAALDLLLDPEVRIVALDGPAGTGKTLAALAAGLEQVAERSVFPRLCIYRPTVAVGKSDLGYLPGSLDEKIEPWMAAIHDALVALVDDGTYETAASTIDHFVHTGKVTMESITHLRGRTVRGFVIVDEAQNLEQSTLKTILTRAGDETKVVFTGDTSQIDNSYVSEQNCALTVLIDTFSGSRLFGHVRLTGCERSEVADLAARML